MSRSPKGPSRSQYTEREVAEKILGDFDPEHSRGMEFILRVFNNKYTVNRLVAYGKVISRNLNIKFPRNYRRNKDLLIKWYDMNLDVIEPFSHNVTINYDEK